MISDDQVALARRPIPAMRPVDRGDWLRVDAAYGAQLAEKARLMAACPGEVLQALPGAEAAVAEFGAVLCDDLAARAGFEVAPGCIRRPDGAWVGRAQPSALHLAAAVVQEDICILERRGDAHVLTAALLAFPASWTLAEKLGRPLAGIHGPVAEYDTQIAARVQRLFDGLRPGLVLERANLLAYANPALYQPRSEAAPRQEEPEDAGWLRSERQTLRKLPRTGAVVFTIHTTVAPRPRPWGGIV